MLKNFFKYSIQCCQKKILQHHIFKKKVHLGIFLLLTTVEIIIIYYKYDDFLYFVIFFYK